MTAGEPHTAECAGGESRAEQARQFSLADLFEGNARIRPAATALVCDGLRLTHFALADHVARTAARLAAIGVGLGDRVAVFAENSGRYVEVLGAAARLGAILVPINWRLTDGEVEHILEDCTPCVIVVEGAYAERVAAAQWVGRFRFIKVWLAIDRSTAPFQPLDAPQQAWTAADAPARPPASAPVLMIYTAAVSGYPQGALISHQAILAAASQLLYCWSLRDSDVNLGGLPLFHIFGMLMLVATQLAGGATVMMGRFESGEAARLIESEQVTLLGSFSPMLARLLESAESGGASLSSLRVVVGLDGAETIDRLHRETAAAFWSCYGQAETSGFVCLAPYRERPGSSGRPMFLSAVRVVDERGGDVPWDQVGEIVVRGPSVFTGYWRKEQQHLAAHGDGWHHTGDGGCFDEWGYLWFKGSLERKELIKSGGENVYPAEVEREIASHPAVSEVIVLGEHDAHWGEIVKAVCICKAGHTLNLDDLGRFLEGRLARYKRPRALLVVDLLPRTPDGRVDRAAAAKAFVTVQARPE